MTGKIDRRSLWVMERDSGFVQNVVGRHRTWERNLSCFVGNLQDTLDMPRKTPNLDSSWVFIL